MMVTTKMMWIDHGCTTMSIVAFRVEEAWIIEAKLLSSDDLFSRFRTPF